MKELPDIGEDFLRRPSVVKQDDGYEDSPAACFAFTAHGFDTDLTPFYSAAMLKAAMQAAWDASRTAALEEVAKLCDRQCEIYDAKMDQAMHLKRESAWDRYWNFKEAVEYMAGSIRASTGRSHGREGGT